MPPKTESKVLNQVSRSKQLGLIDSILLFSSVLNFDEFDIQIDSYLNKIKKLKLSICILTMDNNIFLIIVKL